MSEVKTLMLGEFHKSDVYYLSDLIARELEEIGIEAESFAFEKEPVSSSRANSACTVGRRSQGIA